GNHFGHAGIDGDFVPAWNTTTGTGQTIAVVDTGVDASIPDLAANLAPGGYDFVGHDSNPAPDGSTQETSHGTHVAGLAAASLSVSRASDITGGAPGAHVLAVRALDATGSGSDANIAAAFNYAAAHGARVVNASLGGAEKSNVLHAAIAAHP